MSTIKQLPEKKQAELKQQIDTFYISLIEYLSEFYEFYEFIKFVRIEFFQVTFVELKIHHIDYFDKIFNEMVIQSTEQTFHHIFHFIIKIEAIVNKKANTTIQSIEENVKTLIEKITKEETNILKINLIIIILSYLNAIFNQSVQIFCQSESFLKLIHDLSCLLMESTKYFYEESVINHSDVTKNEMSQIIYRPLNLAIGMEKAFENYFSLSKKF